MSEQPLVLTVTIDDQSQQRFDTERTRWFPAGRTVVGAHITLFHALPGAFRERFEADIETATSERPRFAIDVTQVVPLGRGVAYRLNSLELSEVQRTLRNRWLPELTAQDRQGYRPHVTVQNKVSGDVAKQTLANLAAGFAPFAVQASGLRLWRYDGGPWTHLADHPFGGPPTG